MSVQREVPEVGQLVEVRGRHFIVIDIRRSSLPPNPLHYGSADAQHLVTLSCVEEDAYGEELQVVWEIEPGARAIEKLALPEPGGFDDPPRLDAFLDAVAWGAVASANVKTLQAPFRSGIEIEDYQLDPVVRAIGMPRVNLLIADDVGLGKTIEAGLVVQELMLRHRIRSVVVVCPASIQIQWRDQMLDKFGLEFRIVDTELMRELRRRRGMHVNPWNHFPRLITSIDYLKRERPMRLFREVLPSGDEPAYPRRFDLLIVDEAHNVAPSGRGRYAVDSQRTQAVRTLAPHFEHKLFITATPHNGYKESFSALLELLDAQRFARDVAPDREQLQAVMVRRMKSELMRRWDGSPRFPERKLEAIEVAYPDAERQAHRSLQRYAALRQQGARDATEAFATEFVLLLLKKRLFSSPAAFATTLAKHAASLATARSPKGAGVRPSVGVLRRQIEGIEDEFADDEAYEESAAETVEAATRLFREPTSEEQSLLEELSTFAERSAARGDAKAAALIRQLHEIVKPDGSWGRERVLIFTEYRATQKWLQGLLAAERLAEGNRLLTLHGGMRTEDRERIKAAFQADPDVSPVRILLATDAASEGIDLQNHCSKLVHYEIPWNPNRMEQRNGRIDRHGQRASEVRIHHFVGTGFAARADQGERPGDLEGDLEFLMRAALKVEAIREDLGKVGPVLAQQVEEAMLGRRTRLDTGAAEREAEPVRRLLSFERRLREQIEKLREQLDESRRDLRLSPENVCAVVQAGLELAGQPSLRRIEVPGLGGRAYQMPELSGSWALCAEGLPHPHTGALRPLVFDHALAQNRDDVVLAHLQHRLVQMCLRLLRAEVWSPAGRRNLHRVTARIVPDPVLDAPVVIAHGRLVVLGPEGQRLHEEVLAAGGSLREGRLARLNVSEVRDALAEASPEAVPAAVQRRLTTLWPSHSGPLLAALETRARDRTTGLAKALDERAAREVESMTAVLRELERGIREELDQPVPAQLKLWPDEERDQRQRNHESLRARLARIPGEIERETASIRERYRDPVPRLFPVAVTYLVPRKIALSPEGRG